MDALSAQATLSSPLAGNAVAASRSNRSKSVAVIIEWENARLSELDRARQMLTRLSQQIGEVQAGGDYSFEILILYNKDKIDPQLVKDVTNESLKGAENPLTVSLRATDDLNYYQQKNFGVRSTEADFVIFLDSDVIPDEGWLPALVESLKDPEVSVVSGHPYLTTSNLYEKAFALFWFFSPKPSKPTMRTVTTFPANNVAFRRDLLLANPFPDLESYRGSCAELAGTLRKKGYKIYRQEKATVEHPPPNGLSHFISRALVEGHDTVVNKRKRAHGLWTASPIMATWRLLRTIPRTLGRVFGDGAKVGLRRAEVPGVLGLALAYAVMKFVGEIVAFFAPGLIRRHVSL